MRLNDVFPEEWDSLRPHNPSLIRKTQSNGGSSNYYKIPEGVEELNDLILAKNMPWHIANIFKACYRYGEKEGHDKLYDARKIEWFIAKELEHLTGEKKV